jgi:hypothetical protein
MRAFGLSSVEAVEVDRVITALQDLIPVADLDREGRRNFLDLQSRLIELIPPNTAP